MEIQKIVFKKTSDPMISAGIIGLYRYCEKRKEEKGDLKFYIDKNNLIIESENLEKVLSEMYYDMGKNYYDTSSQKQIDKNEGFYYNEKTNNFIRFPKVKTTGLANLIHDAQPVPLSSAKGLKEIKKENSELYDRILQYGEQNKIKIGKRIWFNDRNTAIPNLDKFNIEKGEKNCLICGESFKKTYESKSFSPFIGGGSALRNFVSMIKGAEEICWKCFYLQRFSPVYAFFANDFGNKTLNIFLFNSNTLEGLKKINVDLLKAFFYTKLQLVNCNYSHNFNVYKFGNQEDKDFFNHFSEMFLMLLYTVYKRVERVKQEKIGIELNKLLGLENELYYNTEIFFFQTQKFASTMRPSTAEKFSEIYYIFQLFKKIDKSINFQYLLWDLKLSEGDDRTVLRNRWAEQILKRKSTISVIEQIVFKNFGDIKFNNRNFSNLIEWLKLYESLINYGGDKKMNDEIRDIAIKLGNQIGYAVRNDKNPNSGRGKLISLRKTRTLSQFLDQIISLQTRYNLVINKEILEKIDEDIFDYFRQFTIISALNAFNLKIKKMEGKNE